MANDQERSRTPKKIGQKVNADQPPIVPSDLKRKAPAVDQNPLKYDWNKAKFDASPESLPQRLNIILPNQSNKLAKSKDPEYNRVMILVRKDTQKFASRKWEDEQPDEDFSELVERLLVAYRDGLISV